MCKQAIRRMFFAAVLCSTTPLKARAEVVPANQWNDEVKVTLARSVIGEAGWRRFDEYSAIAWVYANRAKAFRNYSFKSMMHKYSAAIRRPGKKRNPWLFELGLDGQRPKSWPIDPETKRGPKWEGLHEKAWLKTLQWADEWQAGLHENPCKGANHFGGFVDDHRAWRARWKRVKCTIRTRNRFYTSLVLVDTKEAMIRRRWR